MVPNNLLKGSLETIILCVLKNEGPLHGYAINDKIKLLSKGKVKTNLSSLYTLLHKLQRQKFIVSDSGLYNSRLRIIYALTTSGQNLVNQKMGETREFILSLQSFLKN